MNKTTAIARISIGLAAAIMTSASWAQEEPLTVDPKETAQVAPSQESPMRQPPSTLDVNGKSVPAKPEKLVLADPATKMYMPCRDENDSVSSEEAAKAPKLNPKAVVQPEETAKQHGFKPSPHKVICPKQ